MIFVDPWRDQSADARAPREDPLVRAAVHQAERAVTRLVAMQLYRARLEALRAELEEERKWDGC